jgi:predicted  nucleic acid-binding Zn-ribbon protein
MSAFDALLHLQEHDTTIEQLEHRRATLPERERLAENERALETLAADEQRTEAERDEVARDQKRVEDEVAIVETKANDVHQKLYGGTVTSPKELQALQADFDMLKRRQRELEDRVIELMAASEPIDASIGELTARRSALEAETIAATAALADALAAVDGDLSVAHAERDEIVGNVPEDLLTAYDKLRPQYRGIAVAKLVGNNCGGCHLTLSAMALDRLRQLPPDALATCDECGRILIR